MKSQKSRIMAILLAFAILLSSLPLMVAHAQEGTVHLGVFSDPHYFPNSLSGGNNEAFFEKNYYACKEYDEHDSLLSNALDGIEKVLDQFEEEGANFVLVPGDLTKDGELEGHKELAAKLEEWQARTGIPVFVTNGNHDVNNSNTSTFVNGVEEQGAKTSPEQFREIYKNLGYDKADSFFTPAGYPENKGGMLSYAADLGDAFRLIVVDTSIYSVDNGAKEEEHLTDGTVGEDLLKWVVNEAETAKKEGKTPFVMQHHNIVPHMDIEEATFFAFVIKDWLRVAETYADAGIHYVYTGHLHASDLSSHVNDNGEMITDILAPTLSGYPNYFKTVDMTTDGEKVTLDMVNWDIDDERLGLPPIRTDEGEEFAVPYKYSRSFDTTFGNDIYDFLYRILGGVAYKYFGLIAEAGGIIPFLKTKDIDVEQLLIDLIGTNGLAMGNMDIITVRTNLMGLIHDIDRQIMEAYITNPTETLDKVMAMIKRLLDFEVSPYPCTYNNEVLGTPLTGKGCTLGEYATTALLLYYGGDEDIYGKDGYEYVEDALERFDSGETTEGFFRLLIDVLDHDLIQNEILATIDLNPGELFPEGSLFSLYGRLLNAIVIRLLGGDNSIINIVDKVLSLKVVPDEYSSIDNILNTLLIDKYLTKSQFEAWGATIKWMIKTLVFDDNPDKLQDNNVSLTYSGAVDFEATKEDYRLPNDINMTLAADPTTSATISWITKYTVTDTDIELLDYSDNPQFTGRPTEGAGVSASEESVVLKYPGADLGFIGFLHYGKDYVKHTITLTGLEPGKKYSYRVGSAERGWWSEPGTITTSGGEDEAFTFINITDPQAQRPSHYETYASVMDAATAMYPDARFTVSNGDQVDLGENMKHWNYLFNSSDTFRNMPFMPTSGNHEDAENVISNYFTLANVPEQDLESGIFYSYDYNNVHFTVLNTNDMEDKKLSEEQLEWMKEDIQSSDADWHILILHKALYAAGIYYKDDETKNLRNQLSSLLPYLGVDLVLEGHNHVYTRTGVMNTNSKVPTITEKETYKGAEYEMKIDPQGTIYSIICSAGIKEYAEVEAEKCDRYFDRPECIVENDYPMFSAITVDGNKLYYSAYQIIDGEAKLADSFGISKTESKKSIFDVIRNTVFGNASISIFSKLNAVIPWQITGVFIKMFAVMNNLLSKVKIF